MCVCAGVCRCDEDSRPVQRPLPLPRVHVVPQITGKCLSHWPCLLLRPVAGAETLLAGLSPYGTANHRLNHASYQQSLCVFSHTPWERGAYAFKKKVSENHEGDFSVYTVTKCFIVYPIQRYIVSMTSNAIVLYLMSLYR